ncbi:choice-of-anchor E domain-containing protein [Floridanema aerugineum]|uniref:Choice-of-anchor E domain-containing protein n=1 Tax=Floridaenema aerugineum BLCC-F46 TaxID=3153654 RepID=A0ABV4XGU3_9CYAN
MKAKVLSAITRASTFTGILATTTIANAATLTYTAAYEKTPTDITNAAISIQKFDTSLGKLNSVTLEFTGSMIGDARFENEDTQPQQITVNLSGLLTLAMPNNQTLFELSPEQVTEYNVAKFDGNTDFGGTSGQKIEGIQEQKIDSTTLTDTNSLAAFVGNGTVDFSFSAKAKSSVTGSGNIVSGIRTYAKSNVKVIYDYTIETPRKIPESSTLLGLGLIAGVGLLSQTKKALNKL